MTSDDAASPALEVLADPAAVAERGAACIAAELAAAVAVRGRASLAVSGGRTPLAAFARLAAEPLPWHAIAIVQIDERFAPAGSDERNSARLARAFGALATERSGIFHWMPVDDRDRQAAARRYAATLEVLAGTPPVIDVVQLGLGADGHAASLFLEAALDTVTPTVALAPSADGWPRMTLTLAAINAARSIVWLVTGRDKRTALAGLLAADAAIVGSRVRRSRARIVADRAAAEP
jgi:6-phosphogluconolactonase